MKFSLCLLLVTGGTLAAQAQAVAPSPAPGQAGAGARVPTKAEVRQADSTTQTEQGESPVMLSPFEVSEEDTGYQASSTLSGSRLRTDLRDVAASISVVTKDLMNDLNVHSNEDLLIYTLNTEVGGMGGNFLGGAKDSIHTDFETPMSDVSSPTRIRGLSSADVTRDFFLSDLQTDGYILDRVEISRGANAMLFGLGSPSGIINNGLIKANVRKDTTKIEQSFGANGSNRSVFDHNQVLYKDKLALRLATLYSTDYYRIQPAFQKAQRVFLTATYHPFASTTLRVNTEWANNNSNRPENRPPFDNYTMWWDTGKPSYDPSTGTLTLLGTPKDPNVSAMTAAGGVNTSILSTTGIGAMLVRNIGIVYPDPASNVPIISGLPGNVQAIRGGFNTNSHLNAAGKLVSDGMISFGRANAILNYVHRNDITNNYWQYPQVTNTNIFDYYHYQLEGPNKYEWSGWKTYNFTLEQRFLHNQAGIELSFDRQLLDYGTERPMSFVGYSLYIDINSKLPNGAPNPNYGRPLWSDYGNVSITSKDRDARRGTAYYNLDLRKVGPEWLGKILGRHSFTGTHTRQELYQEGHSGRPWNNSAAYQLATFNVVSTASTDQRAADVLAYIGPSVLNTASAGDTRLVPVTASHNPNNLSSVNVLYQAYPGATPTAPSPWQTGSFALMTNGAQDVVNTDRFASRHLDKFNSSSFVVQSHWLNDTIVSTVGWRNDQYHSYDAGSPAIDPNTGIAISDWQHFPLIPTSNGGEATFNWGVVGHAPNFVKRKLPLGADISLFYNKADNFKPTAQRYGVFNESLAPETGKGKDYGVLLSVFDGKVSFRASYFQSADSYATQGGFATWLNLMVDMVTNTQNNIISGLDAANPTGIAAFNSWKQSAAGQNFYNTFQFKLQPDGTYTSNRRSNEVVATSDVSSEGYEYEAVVNPTRNWRIAFNASRTIAIRNNSATDLVSLLNDSLIPLATGSAGGLIADSTGNTLTGVNTSVVNGVKTITLQDGSPTSELRRWHWSVVTNYKFSHEWLKGVSIGGAVRWQDRIALGFPVKDYGTGIGILPDVKHPYYGSTETHFDAWTGYERKLSHNIVWRLQLNLKNVGEGNKLVPVSAQPDGTIAAYRIADPMSWTLSNSFAF